MKYKIILNDETLLATLPGNLNKESLLNVIKIYLFNDEFEDWNEIKIMKVK